MGPIGFIGLGAMGLPMARNLLKKGFGIVGCDIRREPVALARGDGAEVAASAKAVGGRCDTTVVMVFAIDQVETVLAGPDGYAAGRAGQPGTALVMSSVPPPAIRALADRLAPHGITLIDAPVSGGTAGAGQGTLAIMASGPKPAFERCRPILGAMGSKLYHVGETVGMGSAVKLMNQLLYFVNVCANAEMLALAKKAGLDLPKVREILLGGTGANWVLEHRVPHVLSGTWRSGGSIEIMRKDCRSLMELARSVEVPASLTALASEICQQTAQQEGKGDDLLVFKRLAELAGVEIAPPKGR
jgi:3-hydroxyisobutyrate dehydrogenase-like beta-hydroxyacid dehydrogenase